MAHILVVDSDAPFGERTRQSLKAEGHRCKCVTTGKEALDCINKGGLDLIILDVMLPDISGFEICRAVRRDSNLFDLPILILSAMSGEEEIDHILSQGADDFLSKTSEWPSLQQRAEALLHARSATGDADDLTSLATGDMTKREVQRRLSNRESFALAYVELMGLRTFSKNAGNEARARVIRRMAKLLSNSGAQIKGGDFFVGHMGGGHFVCLIPDAYAQRYCQYVRAMWLNYLPKFFEGVDHKGVRPGETGWEEGQSLDMHACVTFYDGKKVLGSRQLFDILTRLRNKAMRGHLGGVFVDGRINEGEEEGAADSGLT